MSNWKGCVDGRRLAVRLRLVSVELLWQQLTAAVSVGVSRVTVAAANSATVPVGVSRVVVATANSAADCGWPGLGTSSLLLTADWTVGTGNGH
jgi:hypothetical protein